MPVEPPPEEAEEEECPPKWNEPTTVSELLEKYLVEAKISGRDPGTTLFLVGARQRNGELNNVSEGQSMKLFLVP